MYGRETWWLTGIQVSFLALLLLFCVWDELPNQTFSKGTSVSMSTVLLFYTSIWWWDIKIWGLDPQFSGEKWEHWRTIHQMRFRMRWTTTGVAGLYLVVHSLGTEVKASRIHLNPIHRISEAPWISAAPRSVMWKIVPLKIQPWYFQK